MPNKLNNLLSALQQATNLASNVRGVAVNGVQNAIGGIKALVNPSTRNDYITGAKQTLQDVLKSPALVPYKPLVSKGGVPPAMASTLKKATEGFTPAAMSRANNIKINYTPYTSNAPGLPFGARKLFGQNPIGSGGVYQSYGNGGRGEITIPVKYAKESDILRHELIHSMDANTNFGHPMLDDSNGKEYSEAQWESAIQADKNMADQLSIVMKYLSGLGILDSRGFYPSVDQLGKKYINRQVSNPLYGDIPSSRTRDVEGLAYMGTTGNEYIMPRYQSAIQEAIRAANYPPNSHFGIRSLR